MKLVEQHIIRKNNINYKTIEDLSIKSNNLYNTALFILDNITSIVKESNLYLIYVII